jgi:type IV pilus assembly protein PilM
MIGIDVGEKLIKIVELKDTPGGPVLDKYAITEVLIKLKDEDYSKAHSRTISDALKKHGFQEKEVVISVLGPRVQIRRLLLPAVPEEKVTEAIKLTAKNFLAFPIENAVINYFILEKTDAQMDVIVFAVENNFLQRQRSIVEQAGLKCVGVTLPPLAVLEIIKRSPQISGEELNALVLIGKRPAFVNLFKNGNVYFTKEISVNGDNITENLASEFNLDFASAEILKIKYGLPSEDESGTTQMGISISEIRHAMKSILKRLGEEISHSFEYYGEHFGGEKVSNIFISGGTSKLKNINKYIGAQIGVPVKQVDPTAAISFGPEINAEKMPAYLPFLTTSIGLALNKGEKLNLLKVSQEEARIGSY